jgi:tetratricopeptide (TPR) repeat protein
MVNTLTAVAPPEAHIVITVHGTQFDNEAPPVSVTGVPIPGQDTGPTSARGPRWWEPGSAFLQGLDEHLQVRTGAGLGTVEPFRWYEKNSEQNSECHRRRKGKELFERLRREEGPFHLIGHSHGGSVIWDALRESARQGCRLYNLKSWSTVGTPFLSFAPRLSDAWLWVPLLLTSFLAYRARGTWDGLLYYREIGHSNPIALASLIALAMALIGLLLLCVRDTVNCLLASEEVEEDGRAAVQAFEWYGRSWLGLWARGDEAINGLRSTLSLGGEVVPRVGPVTTWEPLGDELFWDVLRRNLQGNDRRGNVLTRVDVGPLPKLRYPPLDDPALLSGCIARSLARKARSRAPEAVGKLRSVLGLASVKGARIRNIRAITKQKQLSWTALLIHTSYFPTGGEDDIAEIAALLALHVGDFAPRSDPVPTGPTPDDPVHAWLIETRRRVLGRYGSPRPGHPDETAGSAPAEGYAFDRRRGPSVSKAGSVVKLSLSLAALILAYAGAMIIVDPYSTRYQIDRVVADAPLELATTRRLTTTPMQESSGLVLGFPTALPNWCRALVRIGRLRDALAAADEEDPDKEYVARISIIDELARWGWVDRAVEEWQAIGWWWDNRAGTLPHLFEKLAETGREREALSLTSHIRPETERTETCLRVLDRVAEQRGRQVARSLLTEVEETNPAPTAESLARHAQWLARQGFAQEAAAKFAAAFESAKVQLHRIQVARILDSEGKKREADELFELEIRAARTAGSSAEISLYNVARALEETGRPEQAVGLYKEALADHGPPRKKDFDLPRVVAMLYRSGRFADALEATRLFDQYDDRRRVLGLLGRSMANAFLTAATPRIQALQPGRRKGQTEPSQGSGSDPTGLGAGRDPRDWRSLMPFLDRAFGEEPRDPNDIRVVAHGLVDELISRGRLEEARVAIHELDRARTQHADLVAALFAAGQPDLGARELESVFAGVYGSHSKLEEPEQSREFSDIAERVLARTRAGTEQVIDIIFKWTLTLRYPGSRAPLFAILAEKAEEVSLHKKASELVDQAEAGAARVKGDRERSRVFAKIAAVRALLGQFREARLAADPCFSEDKLVAYTQILGAYTSTPRADPTPRRSVRTDPADQGESARKGR